MDPTHYKILDKLKPYGHQIEIKYATNGTTLGISKGRTIHDYWPNFKSVAVNVSIDGLDAVYEYIRGNGDWNEVVQNIKVIQAIPNINRVVGAVAVQVSNVLTLDKMVESFLDKLGIVFYTNMVNYPNVLSVQVLPPDLKKIAIERLEAVKLKVPNFKYVKENPILLDITFTQINGVINFINATDQSDKWQDCVAFNSKLDTTRNQSFVQTTPEFRPYV
jgi:MoaA/NifB/PqqE/SkfB family radical SAM enzyme